MAFSPFIFCIFPFHFGIFPLILAFSLFILAFSPFILAGCLSFWQFPLNFWQPNQGGEAEAYWFQVGHHLELIRSGWYLWWFLGRRGCLGSPRWSLKSFFPPKENLGVGGEDSPTQPNPHWFVLPCCGFKPGGAVPLVLEKKTWDSCSSASPPAPKEARYVPAVV